MRTFRIVWLGQIVSLLGSGLTNFGLGVWVFQTTGSATLFATIALFSILPSLLIAPFAGVFVDRWDRRLTMLGSDVLCGLAVLVGAYLVWTHQLVVWHVMVLAGFTSACSSFQVPAYQAAISTLVPKEQLTKAAGMVQSGQAVSDLASPILAGAIFSAIHLQGLIVLDFVSFMVGVLSLAFVRFPKPKSKEEKSAEKPRFSEEIGAGWAFIRERRAMLMLLGYFAALNFLLPMAGVLFGPLVLGFAGSVGFGTVMSVMGAGMLVGSILISVTGGLKNRLLGVFLGGGLIGLFMACVGLRQDLVWIAASGFLCMAFSPVTNASSQAIWQSKVPHELRGRVFSVRRMIAQGTAPIAMLAAGPLVDKVVGPMMMPGGALASTWGRIIGTGPGRGAGLVFVVMGLLTLVVSILFYITPRIRRIDADVPDAVSSHESWRQQ
ncbi:MAG: MFS transporter [Armatimonadetes bacterium]|nr:MFS transporter [Armatimonadota bacterium]